MGYQSLSNDRIVGLDAMRVMLALLGIFLHSGISYMLVFPGIHIPWSGPSAQTSLFYDWLVLWIHAFRMPAFFFLSGFFSYLIFKKVKLSGLSISRIKRVAIPFVVICLFPIVFGLVFQFFTPVKDHMMTVKNVMHALNDIGTFWFLYYLFLFDVICFAVILLFKGIKEKASGFLKKMEKLGENKAFYIICISCVIVLPIVLILSTSQWFVTTDITMVPNAKLLLYYGMFFSLGWAVQTCFKSLITFSKKYRYYLLIGSLVSSILYIYLFHNLYPIYGNFIQVIAVAFYSISGFSMLLGMTGFCLQTLRHRKSYVRYLADSSYWIYLSQIPIIILVQQLLEKVNIPVFEKYLITLLIATAFCLLTYQLLIRNRKIFRYIDGNRKP